MTNNKLQTCDDVYRLPYYFTTTQPKSYLVGNYYNHITELGVNLFNMIPYQDSDEFFRKVSKANTRVVIKVHMHFQRDWRRFWRLASVWYRDENDIDIPFMVVQNSGREGDDYYYRFITNTKVFCKALTYLSQIFRQKMVIESYNFNDIPWEITEDMIKLRDIEDEWDTTIICTSCDIVYPQEWIGSTFDGTNEKHHFRTNSIGEFHGQEYFGTVQGCFDEEWLEDGHIVRSEDEGNCT